MNVSFIVHAFTYMQYNLKLHNGNAIAKTLGFKNIGLTQVDILTWIK